MEKRTSLAEGPLLPTLLKFAVPIMAALLLQIGYGAVDLLVVSHFATVSDVSGVTIGSQLMQTVISLCTGLAMGTTILLGQYIGAGEREKAGKTVGASIALFVLIAVSVTVLILLFRGLIMDLMNAPPESLSNATAYLTITGCGAIFIVLYNLLGSIFRGMGDSHTPLVTVGIACVVNIVGDLLFVAGLGLGSTGAALATVMAQGVSVVLSILFIRRKTLPFHFSKDMVRFDLSYIKNILKLGVPIALQGMLVGLSFLVITSIINVMGVVVSAGAGIVEKLVGFVLLVPNAFMQALSAFVAQNYGAGKLHRANKGMFYGIGISCIYGSFMCYFAFFHGDLMLNIFTHDSAIIAAGVEYLKAYAFDALLVSILFCMIGYFNGYGKTPFVMSQAVFGAMCVRIPLAYFISRLPHTTLFYVGLSTPSSTAIQIILCILYYIYHQKQLKKSGALDCPE